MPFALIVGQSLFFSFIDLFHHHHLRPSSAFSISLTSCTFGSSQHTSTRSRSLSSFPSFPPSPLFSLTFLFSQLLPFFHSLHFPFALNSSPSFPLFLFLYFELLPPLVFLFSFYYFFVRILFFLHLVFRVNLSRGTVSSLPC